MAVSVRMDPLLERELQQAARRQGVTKSQFIIAVMQVQYHIGEGAQDADLPAHQEALRQSLRANYARQQDDYAEFLAQRGKP